MSRSTGNSATCIHHRSSFYVGLGHPRCGTGFKASLITKNGLEVGHEVVRENGIVSWMLPGEKYRNPFYDAIGSLNGFDNIFLIARSPITAIPSIIPENRRGASLRFRRQILRERFGQDPIGWVGSAPDVVRAVASYVNWFELCLSFSPQIIFRVDREDCTILSDYLNHTVQQSTDVDRNSRPDVRNTEFVPEDVAQKVPEDLLTRLLAICEILGYPEDAATIDSLR